MSDPSALINQRIQEYKTTPIIPLCLPLINVKLSNPNTATATFKNIYLQDPMFCQMLVSEGWELTKNKDVHPYAADHALSLIGVGHARVVFAKIPVYEQQLSDEVRFCLSASMLAAELTQQIGELGGACEEAYWTAMFYYFPDTLLWHILPEVMWRISYRHLTLPKKINLFEETKLGFNLFQWRQAVAQAFHLSEQNQLLFAKTAPTNPKELLHYARFGYTDQSPSLKNWHAHEGWLIILANRLARAILSPWHPQSFSHNFKMIKHLMGVDEKILHTVINSSIRKVSESLVDSQLICPSVNYLMLTSKPPFPEWLVKPQVDLNKVQIKRQLFVANLKKSLDPKATTSTPHVNLKPKTEKMTTAIEKLISNPQEFLSSARLIQYALSALMNYFHCDRTSFLVFDPRTKVATTKIALSRSGCHKIRPDYQFELTSPLINFTQKQMFCYFTKTQYQKIWSKIPQAIQQDNIEQFIFCSIKPGKLVKAFIYVDSKNPHIYLPQNIALIKSLMKAVNFALAQLNAVEKSLVQEQKKAQ